MITRGERIAGYRECIAGDDDAFVTRMLSRGNRVSIFFLFSRRNRKNNHDDENENTVFVAIHDPVRRHRPTREDSV
jgi:hypothetical protein